MIARLWHGRTHAERSDAYLGYLLETGIPEYRATPGNQGVQILRRIEGDVAHFLLISYWESFEAIARFAGDALETARYYPRDAEFLLELEPKVVHYEVALDRAAVSG
ncbi:MAG: antibiotic biosynthesis monooxygenase [Chloroflexi bacterium RBG_13_66_10]|jgi:heme-degrading monooxygenase HmoA|nr:MAG: antibiotic biosynthesis monooxygenase [Chloroflexi bacterium RBG_13_66_10]